MPYEIDTQPIVDRYNKMFESGKSTLDLNKKIKDTEINNQALDVENKYKQLAEGIVKQRTEGKEQFYGERNMNDWEIAKETRAKNELAGARNWRGGELIDINLKQNQKRTNTLTGVNTEENIYNKQLDTNLQTGTKEYNTQKSNISKARSSLLDEYNTNIANFKATNEAQKNAEISKKISELQQRDWQSQQSAKDREWQSQMNQNQIDANYSIADRKYNTGTQQISSSVMKYKDTISNYANKYGVGQYTDLLLAKIMQEAGGSPNALATDPMQSSESAGYGRGYFKNPEQSINQGVKYFSEVLKKAGGNVPLALQSYNFGEGFIDYVKKNGGQMTQALINSFSNEMARKMGWSNYGDKNYVQNVLKFYNGNSIGQSYNPSSGNSSSKGVAAVQNAAQFLGGKYVWGGTNPATGVDCSGLTQYVLKQQGISIPRVSQDQWKSGTAVAKNNLQPGDLVFFVTDGSTVSHVGIYEGNGNFVHAASTKKGIVRNNLGDSYYSQHYVGARRYT